MMLPSGACREIIVKSVPMVADYLIPLLWGMNSEMQSTLYYNADMDVTPVIPGAPVIHIRGGPEPQAENAVIRSLGRLRFGLFGSQAYLDRMGEPADLGDLRRFAFIAHDRQRDRAPWEKWLRSTIPEAHYYLRTDCEIAHRVAVHSGLCLGFLPASALLHYSDLVEVPTSLEGWEAPMWMVVDRDALRFPCLAQAAEKIGERLFKVWG